MSGRGRNGGGRSNYHGGHGRSGQQGRGHGGRGNRNNQYNRENGASGKVQKPERFMLDARSKQAKTYRWLQEQENYAGEHYHTSGVQWVLSVTTPGDLPFIERPEEPEEQFYQKVVVPADEAKGIAEETELDVRKFDRAEYLWREELKEYNRKSEVYEKETRALFYSMKSYLTDDAKREIESSAGVEIWQNEDPKELAEVIKLIFLASREGADGNVLDAADQDADFRNVCQFEHQSVNQYYNTFLQSFQSLRVSEMKFKTEEQFDAYWTEKQQVVIFINGLDKVRGGEWWRGFKYRNVPLPATLKEAYDEAQNAEKEYRSVHRQEQQYERINTYHASQRYNDRGNGGRNYSRAVSTGRGNRQSVEVWEDEDGRACCHDFARNDCTYGGDCKYSHKPRVRVRTYGDSNGNRQAKDSQETNNNIDRAVDAAKKGVGFVDAQPTIAAQPKKGSGGGQKPK